MRSHIPIVLILVLFACLDTSAQKRKNEGKSSNKIPEEAFLSLKYRFAGPFRGGRSTAVEGIPEKPFTFFMGSTGGGVWKTNDAGNTWKNVSDGFFETGSIGSIEVSADQNIIYAGTGSACIRGNVIIGRGMYKSMDGGVTWEHIGLRNAGQIGQVISHPNSPDLVYAAALGNPFGRNAERGIFRSNDGGISWEKVLFHSDSVGAIDLVMDPNNPRILFAGLWRAERKPWTLIDGSTEGGLYKSTDGGDNWEKVINGLPTGTLGKISIAISPVNSDRIWVLQEAMDEKLGGLYRSDDGGKNFKRINRSHELRQRAFYYTHVFAHPTDENTVFVTNVRFHKSIDGGKSFESIPTPHGDNHDLWINPRNPEIMIESNDGGAVVTLNGGETWTTYYNQPTSEFYRLTVDNQYPYRLYAAQQDNTTISIPGMMPGGITPKQYWYSVGGGESGHIAVHPNNPDLIYSGNYIGQIYRVDRRSAHSRNVVHYPQLHDGTAPKNIKHRFQWNAPIRISPHNPDVLYHCSQYVHRSADGGSNWEIISPDLTTNNEAYQDIPGGPIQHDHTGVELYTTIFAFEESPHNAGELWAGTDDGRLHISRDAGNSWTEITPLQMPDEGTINMIELSPHTPGRAFISVFKYRENDFRPYIFFTEDFGTSWLLLTDGKNGIPEDHFVRVVREDPDRKGLLYAGTEFGMFISFNNGSTWQKFQLNLPVTPIADMLIKDKDLVIATHGRAFWILDDLTPLHVLDNDILNKEYHLFGPRKAIKSQMRGSFRGGNAPDKPIYGATIHFYLKNETKDTVTISIQDDEELLAKYTTHPDKNSQDRKLEVQKGMNKIVWPFDGMSPEILDGSWMSLAFTGGISMPPGKYNVTLDVGDTTQRQGFTVEKDPRWEFVEDDFQAQYELSRQIREGLDLTHKMIGEMRSVKSQALKISELATEAGYSKEIREKAEVLEKRITEMEEMLIQTKNESGQDPINYPPQLDNQLAYLYTNVNFQDAAPSPGAYERFEDLKEELVEILDAYEEVKKKEYLEFLNLLDEEGVESIILPGN